MQEYYTLNENGHYVFNGKRGVKSILLLWSILYVSVITVMGLIVAMSNSPDKATELLISIAVLSVIVLFCIVKDLLRVKVYIIEISDENVEITIGSNKWTYPVSSFICVDTGATMEGSRRGQALNNCELVFAGASATHRVNIGLVERKLAASIAETIYMVREGNGGQHKRVTAEPFDGSVYRGVNNLVSVKMLPAIMAVMCIPTVVLLSFLVYFKLRPVAEADQEILNGLLIFTVFLIVSIVAFYFVMRHVLQRTSKSVILYLTFSDSVLKINDSTFLISDIAAVRMTSPDVIGSGPCYLEVFQWNEDKPERFIAGKKLQFGMTESKRSEGCSCEYPSLYLAIKKFCTDNQIRFN